jgi:thiol-disulfide isomerase/thioredoxin
MPYKHFMHHILFATSVILLTSLAHSAPLASGQPAPAVDLPGIPTDGSRISLASLRGKVVYLDFWASWCGPCRVSLPEMNTLRGELVEQGFEVLAINVDEAEEDALLFLEEFPVDYPVLWDPSGDTSQIFGILGMPTAFIIDRSGVVRDVHQGFRKGDMKKIRTQVLQLLEEK